jgi:peptidoglycan/xylan/chitin deacetylase (PgdA/CDA1 family)
MVKITFSWDDGSYEDLKLMELSLKHNIPGIFFIPASNNERDVMSEKEIKTIAGQNFEIGAHTYSHAYLTELSLQRAKEELLTGKTYLEQILGNEISHFCFPGGKFNSELVDISKQFYISARTADTGFIGNNRSYLIKPTFHFYDRGKKSLIFNGLKNSIQIFRLAIKNRASSDYFEFIKNIIDDLAIYSGTSYIMIWGHSWEIEKFQLWTKLEALFQYLTSKYPENILSYSDFLRIRNKEK